jgi:hypothetical protein
MSLAHSGQGVRTSGGQCQSPSSTLHRDWCASRQHSPPTNVKTTGSDHRQGPTRPAAQPHGPVPCAAAAAARRGRARAPRPARPRPCRSRSIAWPPGAAGPAGPASAAVRLNPTLPYRAEQAGHIHVNAMCRPTGRQQPCLRACRRLLKRSAQSWHRQAWRAASRLLVRALLASAPLLSSGLNKQE